MSTVRFSRPEWGTVAQTMAAVNVRKVRVDGEPVGYLYGTGPGPGNKYQPTAYEFIANGPTTSRPVYTSPHRFDRLETACEGIARLFAARNAGS